MRNKSHLDKPVDAEDVSTPIIGEPTYPTLEDRLNQFASAGRGTGGAITDGGSETINVAAGTGYIKATDSDVAQLLSFDWDASAGIAIPTNTVRFVGIVYNAGSPIVAIRSTDVWNFDTEWPLGSVVNEAGTLHILDNPWWVTDSIGNTIERFQAKGHFVRDDHVGGLILVAPATRRIEVSGGIIWARLNEFVISSFTSVGDAATFEAYWRNSSGVWADSDLYQYSVLLWNDITLDALQNIQANRYCVIWVYIEVDDDEISILYPQIQHITAAAAEAEAPPSVIPTHIAEHGLLIGRIIIKYNTDAPIAVESVFGVVLTGSGATDHGNLAGLADDDHTQYLLASGTRELAGHWDAGLLYDISVPQLNLTPRSTPLRAVRGGMYFDDEDEAVYVCTTAA